MPATDKDVYRARVSIDAVDEAFGSGTADTGARNLPGPFGYKKCDQCDTSATTATANTTAGNSNTTQSSHAQMR